MIIKVLTGVVLSAILVLLAGVYFGRVVVYHVVEPHFVDVVDDNHQVLFSMQSGQTEYYKIGVR